LGLHQTFAAALRTAREASGRSQADLADRVGLSVEAYGRLERGRVLPRASTLVRLSRALNLAVDQLLGLGPGAEDVGPRAALGRLCEAPPEDLRFLVGVFEELQRWRTSRKEKSK
jgi:transcriptional regulator with XRE-family HTH domain